MIIDPGFTDMAMTLFLFAAVMWLSVREGLQLEKSLAVATARTVAQLALMGFVIEAIFRINRWWVIVAALLLMLAYAAHAALSRMKKPVAGLYLPMWWGVFTGTMFTTAVVTGVVLKADPWWRADVLLPMGGMILGNAMTGGAIAADRLRAEITARAAQIETLLMLGWDYKRAAAEARREAVRAALIPTLNSMMTVGLVHLPGIMVGQMLAGASPATAAKYQIIIMLMIASAVTVTSVVFTSFALTRFFTPRHTLRREAIG